MRDAVGSTTGASCLSDAAGGWRADAAGGWRAALGALGAGLLLALASGCTSDAEEARRYLAEAKEKREAGEPDQALILLRAALKLEPANAETNFEIAEVQLDLGRPGDASFFYGEAFRLDPDLVEAAVAQAPLLYASDRTLARELIDDLLGRHPDHHMAHLRSAELSLLEGDSEAALLAALTSAELAPDAPESHRLVGQVHQTRLRELRHRGEPVEDALFQSALEAFQRAAALDETWYHWSDIARVYGNWPGHDEEAREAWRRAFAASRDADETTREEGGRSVAVSAFRWATARGDRAFGRWALERRLEVDPGQVGAWRQLAAVAEAEAEGGSEAVWKRALAERASDPRIHVAYANHLGRTSGAEQALGYLESLPPELARSPEVALVFVKSYAIQGRLEEARAVVSRMRAALPEDPLTTLAAARLALAEGRHQEAALALGGIADGMERADAFVLLAQAELASGQPRKALAAVNRALELEQGPEPRQLYRLRHRTQAAIGDWEGLASSLLAMRNEGVPIGLVESLQLIRARYELGQPERARRILERLLAMEPPPYAAVVVFAEREGRRQPERARALLEAAIERGGPGHRVVGELAQLTLAQGEPEAALAQLDRAGPLETLSPALRLLRGRALLALGRWDEAESEARAVLEATDGAAAARMLAQILRASDRPGEAITTLERQRSARALSGRNLWLLGRMYLEEGNLDQARIVLEEAVGAAPNLHVAHNDLAFVLAETGGDLERALSLASRARSALPESAAVADTLGWVYYRRGLTELAGDEFRRALELADEGADDALRAEIHYHLGLALRDQGQDREALQSIERALELHPDHAQAQDVRRTLAGAGRAGAGG